MNLCAHVFSGKGMGFARNINKCCCFGYCSGCSARYCTSLFGVTPPLPGPSNCWTPLLSTKLYSRRSTTPPGRPVHRSLLPQGFVTEGDLRFRQRKPLFWNSVVYNASYFEPATIRGVGDILLPGLLQRYAARNCTTEYVPSLGYWLPSPEAGADPQHAAAEGSEFHLSVTVRVPHEVYLYWRGPWEVLKLAWLQYFSVAFPMYWLFVKVKGFLVKSGLLVTRCVSELRPKYKY